MTRKDFLRITKDAIRGEHAYRSLTDDMSLDIQNKVTGAAFIGGRKAARAAYDLFIDEIKKEKNHG